MTSKRLEVTDDSGFLAIVDPDAYCGFVSADWKYDQLIEHFKKQMRAHRLLIWQTRIENIWKVDLSFEPTNIAGFREWNGSIVVSNNRLLLTNYESLTMAAQFADVALPESHQKNLIFPIPNGFYQCLVIQVHNPDLKEPPENTVDFTIEITPIIKLSEAWTEIT